MTNSLTPLAPNPLVSFMRQPKIYIQLPSKGEYWAEGSLIPSETQEYPVFSMTAKDELMLKIPDAVMSGQAVVDVIQNCMPNIKNAWNIPSIDIDVILIAIRIATYGEKMTTPLTFSDDIEMEYAVDLRSVLDSLAANIKWEPVVSISEDLTIFVRPATYKKLSEGAIKTFETQKILQLANSDSLPEEEKLKAFKESFNKLTDVTIGIVENSVFRVDTSLGSTSDPRHIKEFIENADKDIFNKIQLHLDALKESNNIKPIRVTVTDEMREKGFKEEFVEVPLVFDPATFFV